MAAQKIHDGTMVNLATMERTRVIGAVLEVLRYTGHWADIELHAEMPTAPMNGVADKGLAERLLGCEREGKFIDGLRRIVDWYFAEKNRDEVRASLERMLTER